jgi:hypothetical protein
MVAAHRHRHDDEDTSEGHRAIDAISKDDDGKVHIVKKHEQPTRHGAAVGLGWGLAVDVVATLFPPVGIGIVTAGGAGTLIGGVTGHASGGMPRSDLKEPGDILDAGQAGLIAVHETNLADQVAANINAANRVISRATDMGADQLAADMEKTEQEAAIPAADRAGGDASGYEHHGEPRAPGPPAARHPPRRTERGEDRPAGRAHRLKPRHFSYSPPT